MNFVRYLQEAREGCWVYFLKSAGYVKIGRATDIWARKTQIQTSSPHVLMMMLAVPGGRLFERAVQSRFEDKCIRGEWFSLDNELLHFLVRLGETVLWVQLEDREDNPCLTFWPENERQGAKGGS